jgi:asparagine synthase (glutamine-hydrolysing)
MPDAVRLRVDKKGFVTPESAWYRSNIGRIRSELLSPHSLLQLWIDRAKLTSFLQKDSPAIWRLLGVHFWINRFGLT